MYNYAINNKKTISKGKCKGNGKTETSYIYNFKNNSNDLCFLYYVILVKYLCNIESHEYLKYEGKDSLKSYYTHKLAPKVNPDQLQYFIPFVPFISYPLEKFNDEAKRIIEKHYSDMSMGSALDNVKLNKFTREYIYDCCRFMKMLDNSSMFTINADDADLIKQFEELNGVTINIFYLY